jgi:hypothetical protein
MYPKAKSILTTDKPKKVTPNLFLSKSFIKLSRNTPAEKRPNKKTCIITTSPIFSGFGKNILTAKCAPKSSKYTTDNKTKWFFKILFI